LICVSDGSRGPFYISEMIQYKQRPERRPNASFLQRQERKAQQEIEGRAAMAEYQKERQTVLDRMATLKKARLDKERRG
jgi:hypothetical protein